MDFAAQACRLYRALQIDRAAVDQLGQPAMEAFVDFDDDIARARFRHRHETHASAGFEHASHLVEHAGNVGCVDEIEHEAGEDGIE